MDALLRLLRLGWRLYFAFLFILHLIIYFPAMYYLLAHERRHPSAFRLMRFFSRSLVFLGGISYRVKYDTGAEGILEKDAPVCIYCANHTSYVDIPLSYCFIRRFFIHIGKEELSRWPLFGEFFRKMNIAFDRSSAVDSHRAFQRAREELDKGHSLMMFPEGGIAKQDSPHLQSFKNGPFRLAIDKQIPTVPITCLDNWKIVSHGETARKHGGPGIARIIIHKPVETKGMTQKDLLYLRETVYEAINHPLVKEYFSS